MSAAYLSTRHAAEFFDLPVKAFRRLAREEGIKDYPLGPRQHRYKADDLHRTAEAIRLRPRRQK
jgi:hypothetical protein